MEDSIIFAGLCARAQAVMDCYAKAIVHVGPTGAGQTAKMANQMCIAGVLAGLSEAVRLAQGAGLDLDKTYEAISGGAAQSWQMDNRWVTMTRDEFDFGFAIDWIESDGINPNDKRSSVKLCQSLGGSSNWISICSRLEIATVVRLLLRHMRNPTKQDLDSGNHGI